MSNNLLVELFVEELPPRALNTLQEAFATQLFERLAAQGLTSEGSALTPFATPRRLAARITAVRARAPDRPLRQKLMPVGVGLTSGGQATPALLKKLQSLGAAAVDVSTLERSFEGKTPTLYLHSAQAGVSLQEGLQKALSETLVHLPIPKVMTYQLQSGCALPGWDSVQFVRPAHALIALWGQEIVDVSVLGLKAGRHTHGHRFEAACDPIAIDCAENYEALLLGHGAVVASFSERRALIGEQLKGAAASLGDKLSPIEDPALLDEVCALVEKPNVLACKFDAAFLQVPQECLILTMKANQKYFPIIDETGRLTRHFLVVSNISPPDPSAVIEGNERVVRPRLADAQFFYERDRAQTLKSRVAGLSKVVYHNRLGSQGERMERVRAIARIIGQSLGCPSEEIDQVQEAAQLAKTDLLTDMVGEFPELQGVMGRYYALHDGLSTAVANAIEDHYKPRFAGDVLPRGEVGVILALADKIETLVGMFGIGNLPTGDKDPFALRRHALGVIRLLVERHLRLDLPDLLVQALETFDSALPQAAQAPQRLGAFIDERALGYLQGRGYTLVEAEAVLTAHPPWADLPRALDALRAFALLPQALALAAANKRIGNILKKSGAFSGSTLPHISTALLGEGAELDLHRAMLHILPTADAQFERGDYSASLQTLSLLRESVDAFFTSVMVNDEDPLLRRNRQALLAHLHLAMNRVADLSKLASA